MASSRELVDDSCQNKHEMLADFIKNVHSNLRRNVRKAQGDFQSVWKDHCADDVLLKQYSESMKELAVHHWGSNNFRRIEWCKQICLEYFHEGGYEKCLRKDVRRILMNLDQHQNCRCPNEAERLELILTRDPVKKGKLLLLDVGSCFNPFQAYTDYFCPVAIDLCPADKTVFACDFLHLNITSQDDLNQNNCSREVLPNSLSDGRLFPEQIQACINGDKIEKLPENSFNIVVFCLLLTYLPAREQRWVCCKRAHKLLNDGGLLIIITPDSSHQNKNVKMMKSWKTAIESIGFLRWKYHKDEHTHCMAFRKKTLCTNFVKQLQEANVEMSEILYIHQDLQDNETEENVDSKTTKIESNECNSLEGFSALPFSCT